MEEESNASEVNITNKDIFELISKFKFKVDNDFIEADKKREEQMTKINRNMEEIKNDIIENEKTNKARQKISDDKIDRD